MVDLSFWFSIPQSNILHWLGSPLHQSPCMRRMGRVPTGNCMVPASSSSSEDYAGVPDKEERCLSAGLFKARRQTAARPTGTDPILCHLHQPSHILGAPLPVSLPTNDRLAPIHSPSPGAVAAPESRRAPSSIFVPGTLPSAWSCYESPCGWLGGPLSEMSRCKAYLGSPWLQLQAIHLLHPE